MAIELVPLTVSSILKLDPLFGREARGFNPANFGEDEFQAIRTALFQVRPPWISAHRNAETAPARLAFVQKCFIDARAAVCFQQGQPYPATPT